MPALTDQLFIELGARRYQVADLRDASEKFCIARDASGLGCSRVPDAKIVTAEGRAVARISYNGRVWPPVEWRVGMAPLYDNREAVS